MYTKQILDFLLERFADRCFDWLQVEGLSDDQYLQIILKLDIDQEEISKIALCDVIQSLSDDNITALLKKLISKLAGLVTNYRDVERLLSLGSLTEQHRSLIIDAIEPKLAETLNNSDRLGMVLKIEALTDLQCGQITSAVRG